MKTKFPRTSKRNKRNDEFRAEGIIDKIKRKREMKQDGEWEEKKREDKQVKRLKKVRNMESKGKTESNRYKKLKEKVYNPFPEKSPSRSKAIKQFKEDYNRVGKVESGEYDNEKREFHWNKRSKQVDLLPSSDADRPITKGVKKRNLGKNWK